MVSTSPPQPPGNAVAAGAALSVAASLGPFFCWEGWSPGGGWRPLTDLDDPDVIAKRVDSARVLLCDRFQLPAGAVPPRVVASVLFLGIAARLISPVLGAAVVGEVLPVPRRDGLWWRPVDGGPLPVAYADPVGLPTADLDGGAVGAALHATAVTGVVAPLLEVFRGRFRLSPQVLWGNVASTLAGAAGMLAEARPEHAERAGRVLERVLDLAPLAGAGSVVRPDPARARRFLVRRNCCLYYRIPGGGTCADCVLTPPAERSRHWRTVLDAG
ncbi:MAG: hypothetical protein GEV12_22345 [Micromonosporaceae bacterium]|nr:hypothetical protein [Micromonosporaceae bacterium]